MFKKFINKIGNIQGDNNIIFQLIDSTGNKSELVLSMQKFIEAYPLIKEKDDKIELLKKQNEILIENNGLLSESLILKSEELEILYKDKERISSVLSNILLNLDYFYNPENCTDLSNQILNDLIQGDIDLALAVLNKEAIKIQSKSSIGSSKQSFLYILKSNLLFIKNDVKETEYYLKLAVKEKRSWYTYNQAVIFYLNRNENKEARKYLKASLKIAEHPRQKSITLNNLSIYYARLSNYVKAISCLNESISICRELSFKDSKFLKDLAESLYNLGINQKDLYQYQASFESLTEAIDIFRKISVGNPSLLLNVSKTLKSLGELNKSSGNLKEAELQLLQSERICKKLIESDHAEVIEVFRTYGFVLSSLANLYMKFNDLEKAEERYLDVLQISSELMAYNFKENFIDAASFHGHIGALYFKQKRYDEAKEYIGKTNKIFDQLKKWNLNFYNENILQSLINLTVIDIELGNNYQAQRKLDECLQLISKIKSKTKSSFSHRIANVYNLNSILRIRERNYEQAIDYSKKAIRIIRLLNKKNPNSFNEQLVQYLHNLHLSYSEINDKRSKKVLEEALEIVSKLANEYPKVYLKLKAKITRHYAILLSGMGKLMRAKQAANDALEIFENLEFDGGLEYNFEIGSALITIANILNQQEDILAAESHVLKAIERFNKDNKENKSSKGSKIGVAYKILADLKVKQQQFDEALKNYEASKEILKKIPNAAMGDFSTDLGSIYFSIGKLYYNKKYTDLVKAKENFIKVSEYLNTVEKPNLNEKKVWANSLIHLCEIEKADANAVLDLGSKAISLYDKISHISPKETYYSLWLSNSTVARAYVIKGNIDNAAKHYRKANEVFDNLDRETKTKELNNLAYGLTIIAESFLVGNDLSKAKEFFSKANNIFKKLKVFGERDRDYFAYYRCNYALGDIFLNEGEMDLAEDYVIKSINISLDVQIKDLDFSMNLALALIKLADIKTYFSNDKEEALFLIEKAIPELKLSSGVDETKELYMNWIFRLLHEWKIDVKEFLSELAQKSNNTN